MRKLIISCDRCGSVITGEPVNILPKYSNVGSRAVLEGMNEPPLWLERMQNKDFCNACTEKIVAYALKQDGPDDSGKVPKKQITVTAADADTDKEDREKQDNAGDGKNKKLDTGKIMALTKAGWSAAQIADEMGINIQAVYDVRYRAKNKENKS